MACLDLLFIEQALPKVSDPIAPFAAWQRPPMSGKLLDGKRCDREVRAIRGMPVEKVV